ncbi:hypothetical protein [Nocardia sp. NPDC127526]
MNRAVTGSVQPSDSEANGSISNRVRLLLGILAGPTAIATRGFRWE